jgi:hypothetical protein
LFFFSKSVRFTHQTREAQEPVKMALFRGSK